MIVKNSIESGPAFGQVFLIKLWGPAIWLFGVFSLIPSITRGIAILALAAVPASFYCLAVLVRLNKNVLQFRYFYFLPWKQIRYEDILDCRKSWLPALGVMKLRHYVRPWGKLYFLENGSFGFPGPNSITARINEHRAKHDLLERKDEKTDITRSLRRDIRYVLVVVCLGGISFFILNIQMAYPPHLDPTAFPFASQYARFQELLLHWPWNLLFGTLLASIIFLLKFAKQSWPVAFALGGLIGTLVYRILLFRDLLPKSWTG
jgi:hypothetical protein